ncbi:hypothetical protein HO133_009593 [Letharia lupina]|uniref:Uncharacterized protein n=1 Tax=Letharia lupina TaxID=560253 RepID=A0A8H6CLB9_9LECA|nr:uncharacterized protein HO133_009593 [Letharia lupina]KAF6225593.1 hypothetical protein HO133_009593 [Letharia lupina]
MRLALRFALSASVFLIILLLIVKIKLEDVWDQYGVSNYIAHSWKNTFQHGPVQNIPTFDGEASHKVVIMAKMEKENTDWVAENLPDWQAAIYTVNPSPNTTDTTLTTPMNKGRESMAYLSYVIDNYANLPSTLVFLHSHRSGFFSAWHTDTPLHDNVDALRSLQIPFVQKNGYVNLRCNWNPGCLEAHRHNAHVTPEVWKDVFAGTSKEEKAPSNTNGQAPTLVGAACCAQFAVSKDQVLARPLSDYERFREWIIDTEKSDAKSGRVLEFLWHVIFGKDAVYCPAEEKCYCDVYGHC